MTTDRERQIADQLRTMGDSLQDAGVAAYQAADLIEQDDPIVLPPPVDPPPTHPMDPPYPIDATIHRLPSGQNPGPVLAAMAPGDVVLLQYGGTYAGFWFTAGSGRSAGEPNILGAYGDPALGRPILTGEMGMQGSGVAYWDFRDIEWRNQSPFIVANGHHVNFKRCVVRGTTTDGFRLDPQGGPLTDVLLSQCQIVDLATSGDSTKRTGLYANNVQWMTMLECVIDNLNNPATVQSHVLYTQPNCTDFSAHHCLFARGSGDVMLRGGGRITKCVGIDLPMGFGFGGATGSGVFAPGGVEAYLYDCVRWGAGDISPALLRGWGAYFLNVQYGHASGNVFSHGTGGFQQPVRILGGGVGVLSMVVSGNKRFGWGGTTSGYYYDIGVPIVGSTFEVLPNQPDNPALDPNVYTPDFINKVRAGTATVAGYVAYAQQIAGIA